MLHECLATNDILNKPSAIFNCDETGMPLILNCHEGVRLVPNTMLTLQVAAKDKQWYRHVHVLMGMLYHHL